MHLLRFWPARPAAPVAAVVLTILAAPLLPESAASATDSSYEAEYASLTSGAGQVVPDGTASGGKALLVWSNGTADTTVTTGTFGQLVVRAKGDQCSGAPAMTVLVDGVRAGSVSVPSTTWAGYTIPGSWTAGTHRISLQFTNDYRNSVCDRNLRLDRVAVVASTPTAQQEAESTSLTAGAGQAFSDPTASAGRGLLVWSNGTASGSLNASAGSLTVRAEGDQCKGAPHMQVAVDGTTLTTMAVPSTTWADYPVPGAWASGMHRVTVSFVDDYSDSTCDRNLRLDLLRVASSSTTTASPPTTTTAGNPFLGATGYVDPGSNARKAADARRSYDPAGAAALDKIAAGTSADWYGDWVATASLATTVSARVGTETAAGALPVLVAYAIPHRDCGSYSAGGEPTADAYRHWIGQLAAGIGARKAVVVVEPDALPLLDCLSVADQSERLNLIAGAVTALTANPGTSVYLDAGGANWQPASVMAGRLTQANIAHARGFSLDVSNFNTNALSTGYGDSLSPLVGGKPFLVDTSRNGLGAGDTWCNPAGRALGLKMTAATGDPLADAYTWIKAPGESDGTCNGGPNAGTFWTDYAIGLGQRAPQ